MVNVWLFPVSFVVEDGPSRLVVLERRDGGTLTARGRGRPSRGCPPAAPGGPRKEVAGAFPEARAETRHALQRLAGADAWLAGVHPGAEGVDIVYTAVIPAPMAERQLDITVGTRFTWRTCTRARANATRTPHRTG